MTLDTHGIAAFSPTAPLAPWSFTRREPRPRDGVIDIDWCGVCHSDLHTVRGEWGPKRYPLVPGHEIVGRVVAGPSDGPHFRVGETVGVGPVIDSCRHCAPCRAGHEQYCDDGFTETYDSHDRVSGERTQGGYSTRIVIDADYVLRIPPALDPAAAAPLLCAGITTYSPLRHWKVTAESRVGVVGLGGLGHMAVKLARAMGAHVAVFTTTEAKRDDAQRLGAHDVLLTGDVASHRAHRGTLDVILDTAGAPHDLEPLLALLTLHGTLVLLGGSPSPHPSPRPFSLIAKRRALSGSLIGGIRETQEMLDFCAAHGVSADIERLPGTAEAVNVAYQRLLTSDVRYRFVLDMGGARR